MDNEIREWYANRIPHIYAKQFAPFLGEGATFVRYILGNSAPFSITFSRDAETARARIEDGSIVLPVWPLSPELSEKMHPTLPPCELDDFSTRAVGFTNGFLIHEAWHIKETPTLRRMLSFADDPHHKNLYFACINTVEDFYINDLIREQPYGLFVEYLARAGSMTLGPRLNAYHEAVELGTGVLDATLKMLFLYTDVWNTDNPLWNEFRTYTNIINKVIKQSTPRTRARIALELYDKLVELAEEHGENAETRLDDSIGKGINDEDTILTNDRVLDFAEEITVEFRSKVTREGKLGSIPSAVEHNVSDFTANERITPDPRFKEVGTILAQLRTKNYTPGVPRDSGTRLIPSRLWRAATDRMVFGAPRPVEKSDKDEVMFLLDFSGSIGIRFRIEIAAAALGCAYSMRQARLRFMIFAHTGRNRPRIYRIASHQMRGNTPNLKHAFSQSLEIYMSNNYDGFAIQHVAQYFSPGTHNKTLFILSDGQPAGRDYDGHDARDHTARAAKALRDRGVNVLSMSLVSDVVEINNEIYGTNYNIDATGNVGTALRRALLSHI